MEFIKITEQPSLYDGLDKKSVKEILEDINTEDHKVADAVQKAIPQIEKLVTLIIPRVKKGGRIFYMGAGTSGRLGVLDASEIPPTFGMPPTVFIGLIAGGDTALRNPVENAEDHTERGWEELSQYHINPKDTVIGIAASGTTPYVISAMRTARKHGILTGCITSNPHSPMASRYSYRNDCRTRICYGKLTHEIRNRTKDDSEHDQHRCYDRNRESKRK
jgi:N-acetylmuramic acid 6-phosphate etherase